MEQSPTLVRLLAGYDRFDAIRITLGAMDRKIAAGVHQGILRAGMQYNPTLREPDRVAIGAALATIFAPPGYRPSLQPLPEPPPIPTPQADVSKPRLVSLLAHDARFRGHPYRTVLNVLDGYIRRGEDFEKIQERIANFTWQWHPDLRSALTEALYQVFPSKRPGGPTGSAPVPADPPNPRGMGGGAVASLEAERNDGMERDGGGRV